MNDFIEARRASFRSVGDEYDRVRPQYPEAAVEWIAGFDSGVVIDVGCGPGKLTMQLAELGHQVVGIDPSRKMLEGMTARHLPAICGTAEAIPLNDACADLVTVAQAFHWFNHELAVPEMRRVLREKGRVGLLWHLRDESVDWVRSLSRIIGTEDAMSETSVGGDDFEADIVTKLEYDGSFGSIETEVFDYQQELSEEGLVDLVRSRSYVAIIADEEREEILGAVRQLCSEHSQLKGREILYMPYKTRAFRARARA